MSTMGPGTTAEAMALLKAYRGYCIAWGRRIGWELCQQNIDTTSYEVIEEMEKRKLIPDDIGRFWVGAVFNKNPDFEFTGEYRSHRRDDRNLHERTVRVWRLSFAATPPPIPQPPAALTGGDSPDDLLHSNDDNDSGDNDASN